MGRPILKGATDQSTTIYIIDSTAGTPETGVTFETAGIALWYRRLGAAVVAITEVTQTPDGAHSDGGVCHLSDGCYRLDLPDAACAVGSGVDELEVGGTVTGMIVIGNSHSLVNYNPYDGVRMGITALPNAAAAAAGGLPVSAAGGLLLDGIYSAVVTNAAGADIAADIIALKAETVEILADTAVIGALGAGLTAVATQTSVDAIKTETALLYTAIVTNAAGVDIAADIIALKAETASIQAETTAILVDTAVIGALGAGLTAVPWNAAWDAEVQSEVTDALVAHNLDHLALTATAAADMTAEVADNTILSRILGNGDTSTFVPSTDGLHAAGVDLDAILADTNELQTDDYPTSIAAVKADTAAILTDTGTTLDGRIPAALVGGKMDANVGSKTVGLALTAQEKTDVNAEIVDALNVDTYAEPGQEAPAATNTLVKKIGYLFKAWRNKTTQTSTETKLYDDAGTTVDQKVTVSDDATTFTKGEVATGA